MYSLFGIADYALASEVTIGDLGNWGVTLLTYTSEHLPEVYLMINTGAWSVVFVDSNWIVIDFNEELSLFVIVVQCYSPAADVLSQIQPSAVAHTSAEVQIPRAGGSRVFHVRCSAGQILVHVQLQQNVVCWVHGAVWRQLDDYGLCRGGSTGPWAGRSLRRSEPSWRLYRRFVCSVYRMTKIWNYNIHFILDSSLLYLYLFFRFIIPNKRMHSGIA